MLAEMESISESALKSGRMVKLPNGMRLRPVMKRDGTIEIAVRVSSRLTSRVNGGFRGQVLNAENIGKSDGDLFKIWDENREDNPIDL